MWTQVLQGQQRIFVVVQPHGEVLPADAAKTPYLTHTHFKCTVRYTHPPQPQPLLVIEPEHIISHIAYHSRPAGTYGIARAITIFADSLHRDRD
jgi:hypothetical protein